MRVAMEQIHLHRACPTVHKSSSSSRSKSHIVTPACPHHDSTLQNVSSLPSGRRQALLASSVLLQQLLSTAWSAQAEQLQLQQQSLLLLRQGHNSIAIAGIQADYDRYASSYDSLDGGAASEALGFPELRQQLIQQASGDVLEVGVGTGLNLPFYDWSNLTSLTAVDLSEGMLTAAATRVQSAPALARATLVNSPKGSSNSSSSGSVPLRLVQADVMQLPFPDASFDVVLDTFSLCVFSQPEAALAEMARVLRPGGRLLLVEHSRSDNPLLGAYMGATRSVVAPLSKGCDWGQDVPAMLQQLEGIQISNQQRHLAGTLVSIAARKQS